MRWLRPILCALLLASSLRCLPRAWCGRQADALLADDLELQTAMARGMDRWRRAALVEHDFMTGAERFDGEWRFGTYMMGALGYGQTAIAHPELSPRHLAAMEDCIDQLLSTDVRRFDAGLWGSDPLADLGQARDHAAYLGYLNLVLGVHRFLEPRSRYAELNDRISTHLHQRLLASPIGLLQTYPRETYPVDNAAVIASLGLHERVAGADHRAVLDRWRARFDGLRDPDSGLLLQSVRHDSGRVVDGPRGSGTALAAYFLSFIDEPSSRALHDAMRSSMRRDLLGFAAMREYPPGVDGRGDIDSGPVVLGVSISASGFMLASARIHGDRDMFAALWSTAHLFGAPVDRDGARSFALGGPLGDALMFALVTARPAADWSRP